MNGRGRELLAQGGWRAQPARPAAAYGLLAASQWWSLEELRALQLEAVRRLLRAAVVVPLYRERLREAGLAPEDVRSLDDLAEIRLLTREELQDAGVHGLSRPHARGRLRQTSGSTGRPVEVLWPLETVAWYEANDRRFNDWLGVGLGERQVLLPNSTLVNSVRSRGANAALNVTLFHASRLHDRAAVRRLARSLRRRPAALVSGVSNGLYALAAMLLEIGLPARVRACWSGGNHLHDAYRSTIEAALGCRVHERYRCLETGAIAYECPEGRSLHVAAESVIVEIVRDDGRPAGAGETGHVLLTALRNRAMPLVRYRLGDLAVAPADGPCPCGRGLPRLGKLVGRENDLLRGADGSPRVPEPIFFLMCAHRESVLEFQVVQREDLRIEVAVVQRDDPPPEPHRVGIAAALDDLVGLPGATRVERVPSIPSTESGKLRHIVSKAGMRRLPLEAGAG